MSTAEPNNHFDCLSTHWDILHRAHKGDDNQRAEARHHLLERYQEAVRRYLTGALSRWVSDNSLEDAVNDCYQSFCVNLLEGKFKGASPDKGSFRNYLKRALSNLVRDFVNGRACTPSPLSVDELAVSNKETAAKFDLACRWELFCRAYARLKSEDAGNFAVLDLKSREPKITSEQIAQRLAETAGMQLSAAGVRTRLRRARQVLWDLLDQEVRQTLHEPTDADVLAELADLELLSHRPTGTT